MDHMNKNKANTFNESKKHKISGTNKDISFNIEANTCLAFRANVISWFNNFFHS